jgi:hypothetical protein
VAKDLFMYRYRWGRAGDAAEFTQQVDSLTGDIDIPEKEK